MRTLHRSTKGKNRLTLLGVFLGVLILFQVVFPGILPNFFYYIATPVIYGWKGASDFVAGAISGFKDKQRLDAENKELIDELATANERLISLDSLRTQLDSLRELYGRKEKNSEVLAAVLSAPPLSPYDTLVLDAGIRDGVSVGSIVRTVAGLPLGRVTEVFKDFSRVELFSSPGVETPIRVGEKGIEARAIGTGNGEFQFLLPREHEIKKGDPITFPDFSASPFGKVEVIDFQETDFLQLVSFRSPSNLNILSYVLIEVQPSADTKASYEEDLN
jgi:cell shape-determining protein MreC